MRLIALATILGLAAPAWAQDDVTIDAAMQTLRYACNGRTVVDVQGAMNHLTLTGECARVIVTSAHNQITIEAARSIELIGAGNTVTWQRGVGGRDPQVRIVGVGNKISRAAADKASAIAAEPAQPAGPPAKTRSRKRVEVGAEGARVRVKHGAKSVDVTSDPETGAARVKLKGTKGTADVRVDSD